jgi:hypothetical protein
MNMNLTPFATTVVKCATESSIQLNQMVNEVENNLKPFAQAVFRIRLHIKIENRKDSLDRFS